ncbi:MAG: LysR substrate-binding domain-containing protein [Pseudomonadota bacterium]
MNLRDLRYVVTVAETKHFGRAAEACFVSQPTLSGQIKKLEEELGVVIFERTNKRVALTSVGAEIVAGARRVLEQADTLSQVARAHRDPLSGPMRLGVIPSLGPYLIPLIVKPLRERCPQMELVLSEELTVDLTDRLRRHAIDAALLATPLDEPDGLLEIPLFVEPFWLAHSVDDPIYHADEVTRSDLADMNILVLSDGHCLSDQVRALCDTHTTSAADFRATSLETILQLVAAGMGNTLVPALAVRGGWTTDMGIATRELELDGASRQVNLVYRASFPRRQAVEAVAELIASRLPNTVKSIFS